MAYQMVATAVTLNDLEGHSLLADVFKCNPSKICAAFLTVRLHVMQRTVLLSQFCLSVRPSVRLSHAWIVTKLNDALQIFLYHT